MNIIANAAIAWMALAAIFMVVEISTFSFYFSFLSLGALTAGLCIIIGLVGDSQWMWHLTIFFAASTAWAAILWKPLKRFRTKLNEGGGEYNDMVGSTVVLDAPLEKGKRGKVKWSGVLMNARLDASAAANSFPAGVELRVVGVEGNILILKELV